MRGSATSSQLRNAARLIVAPELGTPLSAAKSVSVSVKPRAFQSAARRRQILRDMEAERHRQLLVLDRGDVEVRGRLDPPFGKFDQ